MKVVKATDYGFRKVVRVVSNPNDPEAVHAGGVAHSTPSPTSVDFDVAELVINDLAASSDEKLSAQVTIDSVSRIVAFQQEFSRLPESWEWCPDCIYNWKEPAVDKAGHPISDGGFVWTGEELLVGLNKWGNPGHDSQAIVSTRAKTWDELYQEIDNRMSIHVIFGSVPRQAIPVLVPEVEADFELITAGSPFMENELAKQRYGILRLGVTALIFIAEGADTSAFAVDRDSKYTEGQQIILAKEAQNSIASSIVGSMGTPG